MGLIFALCTALTWAICIFPFTEAARRIGSNSLNNFRLLLAMIIICCISFFYSRAEFFQIFTENYSSAWMWLGISGIVGLTIGDYFAFTMYKILGARIGSVLTTFSPAAALILGGILIHERISIIGIIGIAITIAGVNFVSLSKDERESIPDRGHGSIGYGIVAGILAALCQGAGLVLAKKGMIEQTKIVAINPLNATLIRLIISGGVLLLFTILSGNLIKVYKPVFTNRNNGVKYAVAGTIFGPVLGMGLSIFSVSLIDPSIAQTIFSLVPAFAFLLAAIFMKEKITWRAIIGVSIALMGVLILVWRDTIQGILSA